LKIGLLLTCLMLWIAGCTTAQTADTRLAARFAHSASIGAFR